MDIFQKDLKAMLSDPSFKEEITIETGLLQGRVVAGMFSVSYKTRTFARSDVRSRAVSFLTADDDLDGLKTGDQVKSKFDVYAIESIEPGLSGLTRISFKERLMERGK